MIILAIFAVYLLKEDPSSNDDLFNKTYFSKQESLVYLGDDQADDEILFIFDYSCSWCHLWMDEIYPSIDELITEKDMKFRTQSIAIIDNNSLELSKFDQNIKEHYPELYFEIFNQIMADGQDDGYEELLKDGYIAKIIDTFELDEDLLLADPRLDMVDLTNNYVEQLNLESVPTLVINGNIVRDPFDLDYIKNFYP